MGKFFLALLVVVLLALGAAFWWLQDANRLKPQLETLLSDALEMPVTIHGDVRWVLWPPLSVHAETISAADEETTYAVAALDLDVAFADIWTAATNWQVESLTLTDLLIASVDGAATEVHTLTLENYRPDEWAKLTAVGKTADIPFKASGDLLHETAEELSLKLRSVAVEALDHTATCSGTVQGTGYTGEAENDPNALVPVDTLLSYHWDAECDVAELLLNEHTFKQVNIALENDASGAIVSAATADFFSGRAQVDMHLEPTDSQLLWRFVPRLENVAAEPFMTWIGRPIQWDGALKVDGTVRSTGNTVPELEENLRINLSFDGGEGEIDISEIKRQVASLARYTKEAESVNKWPDTWQYKHFVGMWLADGAEHGFEFALDNLSAVATGNYTLSQDQLDMKAELTFGDDPNFSRFDVNPLLVGLPIPARCRGPLAEAECRLDEARAIANVGRAIASDEGSALRDKIEEKIDEEVPEEYRDAARSLLDLLTGGSDD